ncbi:MAG: hypothetical protein RL095_734 [Verrucomicrobiota bacterium]|jgi:RNA polymerase sigma factor (sigma-70 family)
MSGEPTRITLLQRIRDQHDEGAWKDFVVYYRPYILAVLRNLGERGAGADDLAQEVLLRTWKALPQFRYQAGGCKLRTWLGLICRNTLRSRRRQEQSRLSREGLDDAAVESDPEIEEIAEREWRLYLSNLAWKNIEGSFAASVKESFLLTAAGATSVEVAAKLGLAESSVRVNKQRLTAALCKEILRLKSQLDFPEHGD